MNVGRLRSTKSSRVSLCKKSAARVKYAALRRHPASKKRWSDWRMYLVTKLTVIGRSGRKAALCSKV